MSGKSESATNCLCSLVGRFVVVLGATLHVTGPAHPFTWVDVIIAVIPSHSMIAARGICLCAGSSTVQYSTVQYSTVHLSPVQGPAQINTVYCLALAISLRHNINNDVDVQLNLHSQLMQLMCIFSIYLLMHTYSFATKAQVG